MTASAGTREVADARARAACGAATSNGFCDRPRTHRGDHKPTTERTVDEWYADRCEVSIQVARAEHGSPLWDRPSF